MLLPFMLPPLTFAVNVILFCVDDVDDVDLGEALEQEEEEDVEVVDDDDELGDNKEMPVLMGKLIALICSSVSATPVAASTTVPPLEIYVRMHVAPSGELASPIQFVRIF